MEKLTIAKEWNKEDAEYVLQKLSAFNKTQLTDEVNSAPSKYFNLIYKNDSGQIQGGIVGMIQWQRMKIDMFWLEDSLRGQGLGKELLAEAEALAKEEGCHLMELDTFSFQAPEFYKKQGFEVFGQIENFPPGHTHYYLMKRL